MYKQTTNNKTTNKPTNQQNPQTTTNNNQQTTTKQQQQQTTIKQQKEQEDSVHYLMMPTVDEKAQNPQIEKSVSQMQTVIDLTRTVRDMKTVGLSVRIPVLEVMILHPEQVIEINKLINMK